MKQAVQLGLVLLAMCVGCLPVTAQNLWRQNAVPQSDSAQKLLNHYAQFTLNTAAFTTALRTAPAEGSRTNSSGQSVYIPKPNGELVSFFFEETKLFTPTAGTTIDVKTYTGYNKDRSAVVHLTVYGNQVTALAIEGSYKWFISRPAMLPATA